MTCVYPLSPEHCDGIRCGKPATTVRILLRFLPPASVCAEHAAAYDRARGYGETAEEKAIAAKVEAARLAQIEADAAMRGGAR
jgi:hypothetical protein